MGKSWRACLLSVCLFLTGVVGLFGAGCKEEEKREMQIVEYGACTAYIDVAYGDHERHAMDVCIPNGASGEVGVIVLIHGGGWMAGDKETYRSSLEYWSGTQGFVTIALNYRYASLEDGVHVADLLNDITSALYKAKNFGAEKGVELNKALLSGGSAGAHLSLQYAYTKADVAPIAPKAVCSFSGPTDLTDRNYYRDSVLLEPIIDMIKNVSGIEFDRSNFDEAVPYLRQASPIEYVTENTVPTIICQGQLDDIVPLSNGIALADKLTKYGVENELFIYSNSGHGLESDPEIAKQADALMLEYARKYLA